MHWNVYTGDTNGVGGADGREGAMRLHALQLFLLLLMSTVMPGQNTEASALAIMDDTP